MASIFISLGMIAIVVIILTLSVRYVSGCLAPKTTTSAQLPSSSDRLSIPRVCQVWDRWTTLETDLTLPESARGHLLGSGWSAQVCPRGNQYQQINQLDHWCSPPGAKETHTAALCSHYISNDALASPIAATCADTAALAPFDRWVALKEPLGVGAGTLRGSAWERNVCPAGACFQLLNNNTSWCVPVDQVAASTIEAAQPPQAPQKP